MAETNRVGLQRWIWRAFVRSALIPLVAVAYLFRKKWAERWLRNLWYLQLALGVLLLVLKMFPVFDQDNSLAMATFMPVYLAFSGVFYWQRRKQ